LVSLQHHTIDVSQAEWEELNRICPQSYRVD